MSAPRRSRRARKNKKQEPAVDPHRDPPGEAVVHGLAEHPHQRPDEVRHRLVGVEVDDGVDGPLVATVDQCQAEPHASPSPDPASMTAGPPEIGRT